MTSATRKELILLAAIAVISLTFFFSSYTGYSRQKNKIDPTSFFCEPHNYYTAFSSQEKQTGEFSGGYWYTHKNTYHGTASIGMEPTSPDWHVPAYLGPGQIKIYRGKKDEKGKKQQLQFHCTQHTGKLPLVLLVADPDDLFDPERGIYVEGNDRNFGTAETLFPEKWTQPANYFARGKEQKRSAFMVYYNPKGEYNFSAKVNLQISGNATRAFPQKSLRVDLDGQKKKKRGYAFFADKKEYTSMVLRNGGNDWSRTLISDGLMQEAMQEAGVDVLGFIPCNVYLNGIYWGIYAIRNRSNEKYIAEKYGVEKKQVSYMENWTFHEGDESDFKQLMKLIEKCGKSQSGGADVQRLEQELDLEALAKYFAAQIFYANTDWPSNNIKAFRIKTENKKAGWRFILFDLDYGMGYTGADAVSKDMFEYLEKQNNPMGRLYKGLMKDENFRRLFKNTFARLLEKELSAENLCRLIEHYRQQLQADIPFHLLRWRKPAGVSEWSQNVNALKQFAQQRGFVVKQQLVKHIHD